MFGFLHYGKLLQLNTQILKSQALQNPFLKAHFKVNPTSSFLQFLQNSCGLPPARALKVCERYAKKPRNADSVLALLKSNGFSDAHIKSAITKAPQLLVTDAESILLPKIQYFKDKGLSDSDVIELIALRPYILKSSLERFIKPLFNFFFSHLGTDDSIIKSMKRTKFQFNLHTRIIPNVEALRSCGVPDCRISRVLLSQPAMLMKEPDQFGVNVKKILKMGLNPSNHGFVEAVRMLGCLSYPVWDMKFKLYKSFGWSNEEIMSAFRKHPGCFGISEEKIREGMNFFVNKLGWSPPYISSHPSLVLFSLEKRILPRKRFLEALAAKGLITKDKIFQKQSYLLSEKRFLENYVTKFQAKFPEILKLYEGIMDGNGQDIKDKR